MKYALPILFAAFAVAASTPEDVTRDFRQTLAELVKADTTNPPGNEARAVAILARRLKEENIAYEIVDFGSDRQNVSQNVRQNLIARLKGDGTRNPLLLLAHVDVVGTKDQNWSTPPHEVTEKDGFLYARGVADDLGMAVTNLEVFLRLKREKVALKRDVILAFTGAEESLGLGIRAVLEKRPELLDAEIALNEGGGIWLNDAGNPYIVRPQLAEKIYRNFSLSATGETGHSSIPKKNNAVYKLARALDRLAHDEPERRLLPVTRAYFRDLAKIESGEMARALAAIGSSKGQIPKWALKVVEARPAVAVLLSTTCVATMLSAGTEVNALAATASANVNCRILPDENVEQVQARLVKIVGDPEVTVTPLADAGGKGTSPLEGEVMSAIQDLAKEVYHGLPVVPEMASFSTDSRFLRERGVQAYGFNPIATYEKDASRWHGIDERIPVASIQPAIENMYRLVLKLAR
ncbi:MAG: peptidase M20 [Bdellovibrio sp.]|nr:MAG: peptidase M20 [Bdellovibrio sp.]